MTMTLAQIIRSKLRRESIYLGRDISYAFGRYDDFYKSARGSRIVVYHGICQKDHLRFNPIFLTYKTFEAHLKLYKKYFNVVSLNDYYEQRFSDNRFNICITFDDGFANNFKYVLPLLEQYRIPATFFITSIRAAGYDILWNDFLGIISKYGPQKLVYKDEPYYKGRFDKYISTKTGISLVEKLRSVGFEEKAEMMELLYPLLTFKMDKRQDDYWLQMTVDQITALSSSPFANIGAHGYYHNDLAKINIADAANESKFSKQYLEDLTGQPINSFAFPYGAYNDEVIAAAKQAGYQQLLATDFHSVTESEDRMMRERFTVNPFISPNNQMYATITRRYEH